MKVNKLLEDEEDFWYLYEKYPLVEYILSSKECCKFITDLPLNIQSYQLFQLAKLSFTAQELDILMPQDVLYLQAYTEEDPNIRWREIERANHQNLTPTHISCTWVQFVDIVKKKIAIDNDFED